MGNRALGCSLALLLTGCVNEPVEWGNVSYRQSQLGDPDTRSSVMSANLPAIAGASAPCIMSIRTAASAGELFRAWWSARSDSSVILSMQHSGDQARTWQPPVEVEPRDRGRRGCDRPAPGIFYDPASGNVHLVYFIEASDGAGVFFAHSMDKGEMFHSPVPVVFGNSPSPGNASTTIPRTIRSPGISSRRFIFTFMSWVAKRRFRRTRRNSGGPPGISRLLRSGISSRLRSGRFFRSRRKRSRWTRFPRGPRWTGC